MRKLRVGIIGCGTIAESQAMAASQLKNTQLVAVCDRVEDNVNSFAENIMYQECLQITNFCCSRKIDAIYNCTPNYMHKQIVVDAAKAGKHILTQKPFAITMEDAKEMCKAVEENGVIMQSGFFERFRGYCQAMKRCVDEGYIGTLKMMKAQMSHSGIGAFYHPKTEWFGDISLAGGGALADLGVHHLDLMRWLAGSEVKAIDAQVDVEVGSGPGKKRNRNITYHNGVMAQGHWSFSTIAPEGVCYDKFELYGDEGTIFVTWAKDAAPRFQIVRKGETQWKDYPYEEIDGFYAMQKHFADCVLENLPTGKQTVMMV